MRNTITATKGHILTDGNIYGTTIHLAEGIDASGFYEITEVEYAEILNKDTLGEPSLDDATEADYQSALAEFGVKI